MIMHEQNGYLILAHLSDIELYYTSPEFIENEKITLQGEEFHHAVNVMRNYINDPIYITDGVGKIYECEIVEIGKSNLKARVTDEYQYKCNAANIWFCIPVLKNPDRLKFAFEKCVELGITNFILFTSNRTIPKKINLDKYLKTTQAAMKQSLRAFLPKIISTSFDEINKLSGDKILFDQKVNPRDLKRRLARTFVTMYHNKDEALKAEEEFDKVFIKKDIPDDIPEIKINGKEIGVLELLMEVKYANSKGEAKRLVNQGGVSIDGNKVNDMSSSIILKDGMVLKVGKRKFIKLIV